MALKKYALITTADSVSRKLRMVFGQVRPTLTKTQTRKRTITGKADTTQGYVVKSWTVQVKVRDIASDPDPLGGAAYATLTDLRNFFSRVGTTSTTNARFTFVENDDTKTHTVELLGEMSEESLTPNLTSANNWILCSFTIEKVD